MKEKMNATVKLLEQCTSKILDVSAELNASKNYTSEILLKARESRVFECINVDGVFKKGESVGEFLKAVNSSLKSIFDNQEVIYIDITTKNNKG